MSILKQKFENYSVQPDEKVWSSIQHTMNTRAVARRRRSIAAVASTLLVGGAVAVIAIVGKNANPVADSPVASRASARGDGTAPGGRPHGSGHGKADGTKRSASRCSGSTHGTCRRSPSARRWAG